MYPAREAPIPGVGSGLITGAAPAAEAIDREAALELVSRERTAGDGEAVLVFMGAGDVTDLAHAAIRRRTGDAVGA